MRSQKALEMALAAVHDFTRPNTAWEQYQTPARVAARLAWQASLDGDIKGKRVYDPGCGTGIMGIAALHLGAKHVTFLDVDASALSVLVDNLKGISQKRYTIIHGGVTARDSDTVLMNPPFGTKQDHADREFLLIAMQSASSIHSIHLASSERFLSKLAQDNGFSLLRAEHELLALPATMPQHKKAEAKSPVILVTLKKKL